MSKIRIAAPALALTSLHTGIMASAMAVMYFIFSTSYGEPNMTVLNLPFLLLLAFLLTLGAKRYFNWDTDFFPPMRKIHLLWLVPILLAILQIYVIFALNADPNNHPLFATAALLLATMLIGYTEELTFRGILMTGLLRAGRKTLTVIIISGLAFGLFHFVNLLGNAPFDAVLGQVVSTAVTGLCYGAVFWHLKSLWPLMLVHWQWDAALMLANRDPNVMAAIETIDPILAGYVMPLKLIIFLVLMINILRKR